MKYTNKANMKITNVYAKIMYVINMTKPSKGDLK